MKPIVTVIDLNAGHANQGVSAICDRVRAAGAEPMVWDLAVQQRLPHRPGQAVLLSGGPGSPLGAEPWRRRLQIALPSLAARAPTLGICLGFQVMASAWRWRVALLQQPRLGVYQLKAGTRPDRWLPHLPAGSAVFEQHRWAVWPTARATGRVLATSTKGDALAVRFTPLAAGVIFHPEAAAAPVTRWLSEDPTVRATLTALQGADAADRQAAQAGGLANTFQTVLPGFLSAALRRAAA